MSIEHTARTGADKGYVIDHARGLLRDDERRLAQGRRSTTRMQNVAAVTNADAVIAALKAQVRRDAEGGAGGDERALMERLAVDQRAVDVPGDRAKEAHGAASSDRSARRR